MPGGDAGLPAPEIPAVRVRFLRRAKLFLQAQGRGAEQIGRLGPWKIIGQHPEELEKGEGTGIAQQRLRRRGDER